MQNRQPKTRASVIIITIITITIIITIIITFIIVTIISSLSSLLLSSDTPRMEELVEESMITAVVGRMGHLAEPTLPNIIYIIYLTTQIQMHHCPVM